MVVQFPHVRYQPPEDWVWQWECKPSLWREIIQPSVRVAEVVKQYVNDSWFLVGIHIRSYWLKVHDAHLNNRFNIQAQDFLDCALSIRNEINTSKAIRYYIASDSTQIAEEMMRIPNF